MSEGLLKVDDRRKVELTELKPNEDNVRLLLKFVWTMCKRKLKG